MKKLGAIILVLAMVLSLAACGNSSTASSQAASAAGSAAESTASGTATDKPLKLGISVPNLTNVFFVQIKDGMQKALKSPEDSLVVMDSQGDQNKQMNDVIDLINQGCNVIGLSPINSDGVRATLETCQKAGVPVIAFNVGVKNPELVASTIVSDNEASGHMCAQALAKALNNKGNVVEVTFSTTTTCYARQKGFEDEIKANYPDIKILQSKDVEKATADYSQPIMVDFINAYPDLDGVFTINDPTARGAISALKEAGKIKDVKVVSVDGSDEGKGFIRAGEMVASAAQDPTGIGSTTVGTAYKLIAGQKVEANIIMPMSIIDASNVDK
ncbi:substrate-binding domain-containing protein [Caproiciproducens sp. CPB-2]|uniref:substrate-binding domain-containing protein n=1 Tax=Caproiciproducens sp. CPB-2 TaxID=3030017 RepID=UPI0023DA4560|nr:substrate-binding domain-containing protein [Caproiciproducens sp. CPB-2]MDF1496360.1 substrate-binding domain-containing protein [Caproiciproducens sp. CPB-2]